MRTDSNDLNGFLDRADKEVHRLADAVTDFTQSLLLSTTVLPFFHLSRVAIIMHPDADPNMDWSDEYNVRGGYRHCIPGLLGEVIPMIKISQFCDYISFEQNRCTQAWLGIDVHTTLGSIQCKTVRFEGDKLTVWDNMYTHCADFTSLTDIDDREVYLIPREVLSAKRSVISKTYLQQQCVLYFKIDEQNPRINRLDLVSPSKFQKLIIND